MRSCLGPGRENRRCPQSFWRWQLRCRTSGPTPGLGLSLVHEALYLLSSTGGPVRWVLLIPAVSQMGKPTLEWVTWTTHTQMAGKWWGWAGLWPSQLWSPHSWPLYTKFYLHVGPWVQNTNRAEHFSQRSLQGILTATGVGGLWCLNISVVSYSCCSVAKSCLTLCNLMDCSTPSLPVLHHLPERLGCFNSL